MFDAFDAIATAAALCPEFDAALLAQTVREILALPLAMRPAAVESFAEVDPDLAQKLRLELSFALS
jgi:hypothetical protein